MKSKEVETSIGMERNEREENYFLLSPLISFSISLFLNLFLEPNVNIKYIRK